MGCGRAGLVPELGGLGSALLSSAGLGLAFAGADAEEWASKSAVERMMNGESPPRAPAAESAA